jgi:hypothetical protein
VVPQCVCFLFHNTSQQHQFAQQLRRCRHCRSWYWSGVMHLLPFQSLDGCAGVECEHTTRGSLIRQNASAVLVLSSAMCAAQAPVDTSENSVCRTDPTEEWQALLDWQNTWTANSLPGWNQGTQ